MKKAAASRKRKQEEEEAAKVAVVAKRYEKNQFQIELNAHDRRCSVAALEKVLTRHNHDSDINEFETDPGVCAERIEKELFKKHRSVLCEAYDEQLRSILFNLQKEKNTALRGALLRRTILPAEFVAMNAQDMANPDLAALRDSDAEWAKTVAMAKSLANLTPTTAYTCRKCNNNKCSMSALQIRSADEGMTTFVSCDTCGHRWQT